MDKLGLQHSPSIISSSSLQTDRLGSTASISTLNPHYKQEFLSKRGSTMLPENDRLPTETSTVDDVTRNKSMVVAGNNLMLEKDTMSPKEVHRTTLIVNQEYTDDSPLPTFGQPDRAMTVVNRPGRN